VDVIRVTDDSPAAVVREAHEARIRRLMAQRAALPVTWEHRAERAALLEQIEDAFGEWERARL